MEGRGKVVISRVDGEMFISCFVVNLKEETKIDENKGSIQVQGSRIRAFLDFIHFVSEADDLTNGNEEDCTNTVVFLFMSIYFQ